MNAITAIGPATSTTAYQATPANETQKQNGTTKAGHHGHHHRPAPAAPATPATQPSSLLDVVA